MNVAVVGVGRAGGRIADAFRSVDGWPCSDPIEASFAIDTSKAYLRDLSAVPNKNRLLVGKDRAKGHGVGADNELAATIAEESRDVVVDTIDDAVIDRVDAVLVVAGLGGGTGSGAAPVITDQLSETYPVPVYGLGVLPDRREGDIYTLNAARSYLSFVDVAEHLFLFDNDAWRREDVPNDEYYAQLNEALVMPLGVLFGVASIDQRDSNSVPSIDPQSSGEPPGSEPPPSGEGVTAPEQLPDVLKESDISTLGYAVRFVGSDGDDTGFLSKLWRSRSVDRVTPDEKAERAGTITALVRQAIEGKFTLPYDISNGADTSLGIVGPPAYLDDGYLDRCCRLVTGRYGRVDVRLCDAEALKGASTVAAVVLFTDLHGVDRIDRLTETAVDLQRDPERLREETDKPLPGLVAGDGVEAEADPDERSDIQPLF